ncbi:MAG: HYR domain-containing protein [Saprospiraceae bacterium]|nr:HYR domain-containing protein [Saprospiraceae bacterium]
MVTRFHWLMVFEILTGAIVLLTNYASDPPNGYTNAPFDHFCSECHSPSASLNGMVAITGLPAEAEAGTLYTIRLTAKATTGQPGRGGFQLVSVYTSDRTNAGDLMAIGADVGTGTTGGREYIDHRGPKSFSGDSVSWTFNWLSPANPTSEEITMYFAANLTNGNGSNSGDHPVSGSYSFNVKTMATPLTTSISSLQDVSCFGLADGSASVEVNGGTPPYQYLWSNGTTAGQLSQVPSGLYSVTISDANGQIVQDQVQVQEPAPLQFELQASPASCADDANGQIVTFISGGSEPYQYQWSNGMTSNSIAGLIAGNYSLTITDSHSCTEAASVLVVARDTTPPAITCPEDLSSTTSRVIYPEPLVSDNCGIDSLLVTGFPSGSLFPVGTSLIEFTAVDLSGNTSNCSFQITVDSTTSHRIALSDNWFNIYPNPVADRISILAEASGKTLINLYDARGQVLLSKWIDEFPSHEYTLQVPWLASGIYFIQIQSGEKSGISKILKQ